MTIIDLIEDWLESLVPHGFKVLVSAGAIAAKIAIDFGDGDSRLDADTRLDIQAKLNQALLTACIFEVV
jgi:hypothetical protein